MIALFAQALKLWESFVKTRIGGRIFLRALTFILRIRYVLRKVEKFDERFFYVLIVNQ